MLDDQSESPRGLAGYTPQGQAGSCILQARCTLHAHRTPTASVAETRNGKIPIRNREFAIEAMNGNTRAIRVGVSESRPPASGIAGRTIP